MHKTLLILLLLPIFAWSQHSIPASEYSILKGFYQEANGENWDIKWDFSKDPQQWFGVKIQQGHVTELNLAHNGLAGKISSLLGNLSFLKKLDVSSNRLSGNIYFISGLSALEVLNLNENALEGDATSLFSSLTRLTELSISDNKFSITSPGDLIANLPALTRLELAKYNLKTLPQNIGSLQHLKKLDISETSIKDFSAIASLSKLQELRMSHLNLKKVPTALASLKNLLLLDLSQNQITDFNAISSLKKLEWLSLDANQLTKIPTQINNLTHIVELHLSNNLIAESLSGISNFSNLQQLWLNNNRLKDFPTEITNLQHLMMINLSDNELEGPLPSTIPTITDISNNRYTAAQLLNFCDNDKGKTLLSYRPQRFDEPEVKTAALGSKVKLDHNLPTDENYEFLWLKNLDEDTEITTTQYSISTLKETDLGFYTVEAFLTKDTPSGFFWGSFFREPIELVATLSTDENQIAQLSVYPNPTSDNIYIKAENQQIQNVKIYDMSGKLLKVSGKISKVPFSDFPAGVYIIRVETTLGIKTFKIIKK